MLYLYLGFIFAQSFSVADVIYNANIPPMTIVFSIIVFLVWSLLPFLGYGLAKLLGAQLKCSKLLLIILGVCISIIEQLLFHFDLLTTMDGYLTTLVTAALFFIITFIPWHKINYKVIKVTNVD
jgi:hypothetical protein